MFWEPLRTNEKKKVAASEKEHALAKRSSVEIVKGAVIEMITG